MSRAFPRIGRLDQSFQNIKRRGRDPVTQRKLLVLRKFLDGLQHPSQKLIVGLKGWPGAACVIRQGTIPKIQRPGASPLDPRQQERKRKRGKGVKIQGVSVLASRKPPLKFRRSVVFLMRSAARRPLGALPQE